MADALRAFVLGVALGASPLFAQSTVRISAKSDGSQIAAHDSQVGPLSGDGRFVSFVTRANVVPADQNGVRDGFVVDRSTGQYDWVTISLPGSDNDGASYLEDMTPDGRFVTFSSRSSQLVAGDTNGMDDVFVRDRALGTTELISVAANGGSSDDHCGGSVISDDGHIVAFWSHATNLVASDTNGHSDVFVRDRWLGTTTRVSVGTNGAQGDSSSSYPAVSGDGRTIAFFSLASNWTPSGAAGLFVRDLAAGTTTLASVDSNGAPLPQYVFNPSLSFDGLRLAFVSSLPSSVPYGLLVRDFASGTTVPVVFDQSGAAESGNFASMTSDGRFLLFESQAADLVAGDTNGTPDVFVVELATGTIVRASVSSTGVQMFESDSEWPPRISDDGRFVLFESVAPNLVPGDTNAHKDVFLRDRLQAWFADQDGDEYGVAQVLAVAPPQGHVAAGGDCDDSDPSVHPFADELPSNAVDEDCDGYFDESSTYCSSTTTSLGCVAHLEAAGVPSASASSGFALSMTTLPGQVSGTLFYGLAPTSIPIPGSGTRCVQAPVQRLGATNSGSFATDCAGAIQLDWLAYMASQPFALGHPLTVGHSIYVQGWFRDGGPFPTRFSEAIQFVIAP